MRRNHVKVGTIVRDPHDHGKEYLVLGFCYDLNDLHPKGPYVAVAGVNAYSFKNGPEWYPIIKAYSGLMTEQQYIDHLEARRQLHEAEVEEHRKRQEEFKITRRAIEDMNSALKQLGWNGLYGLHPTTYEPACNHDQVRFVTKAVTQAVNRQVKANARKAATRERI